MARYKSLIKLDIKHPTKISGRLISIGCILIIAVLVGWLHYHRPANHTTKPTAQSPAETVNKFVEGSAGNSQTSNNNPAIVGQAGSAAPQPPNFTVYFPPNPPAPMTVDKSSITYSKNLFSYSLLQDGQDQFFVEEQPVGTNFSFQRLKVRLGSPQDVTTSFGAGVLGTIGTNLITATKTSKNTLIIVNCTALQCLVPSGNLISSMQINSDPTHIK